MTTEGSCRELPSQLRVIPRPARGPPSCSQDSSVHQALLFPWFTH